MKKVTPPKVHSMYKSLAREAWEFWGRTDDVTPFEVKGIYENGPTYAHSRMPSLTLAMTYYVFNPNDVTIRFNSFYLPYMDEDEVIVTILHELAHAHVGVSQWHNDVWASAAEEIGSVPQEFFLTRSAWNRQLPWVAPEVFDLLPEHFSGPTLDTI